MSQTSCPSTAQIPALLLVALIAAVGCQGRSGSSFPDAAPGVGTASGAPDGCEPAPPPLPCGPTLGAAREAVVDLGGAEDAYAGDERTATIAALWPQMVGGAFARLLADAGLGFPAGAEPRVVLSPFGDERVPWQVETEIAAGRRRPVAFVNLEPILGLLHTPESALGGALAEAALVGRAPHRAPPPAWVVRLASLAGRGDADARLEALARRLAEGARDATWVDPGDPEAAEATALAAWLVLRDAPGVVGGDGLTVQRFLHFVADGDDGSEMLARVVRDPLGRWAGSGRARLAARLADIDTSGWELVLAARRAWTEAGRVAFESMLPEPVPGAVHHEIEVLRAEAFLDEGDFPAARLVLAALDETALARLEDPGRGWRLRLRAEEGPGGDRAKATAWAKRIARDFPAAWRRGRTTPAAGEAIDPARVDLERARGELARLLSEHRSGAAQRLIDLLGDKARAPELESAVREAARAETRPTPEAVAANVARVRAWLARPTPETASAVRGGGAAAARALAPLLPIGDGVPTRKTGVRLLAEAAGPGRAVRELAPVWQRAPSLLPGDLDALLGVTRYHELKIWVEGHVPHTMARMGGERTWEHLRHGLDEAWLAENDDVLEDLRDPRYPTRRHAFQRVVDSRRVTPELVAFALNDAAPLLRREATRVAGEERFDSLVRLAFEDEAWVVRLAACAAAIGALGPYASTHLRKVLTRDPAPQVRLAAAQALLDLAQTKEPALIPFLVSALETAEPQTADLLVRRLPELQKGPVACAVLAALEREARRPCPRAPHLSRLFVVLQRTTERDPGYYPAMTPEEIRRLVAWLRQRLEPYLRGGPAIQGGPAPGGSR